MQAHNLGAVHALLGHPGLFIDADADSSGDDVRPLTFRCTAAAESVLSSSEVETVNRVVRCGGSVAFLRSFVRDARGGALDDAGKSGGGLYLSSIASAVEKLLRRYHGAIAEAEDYLRRDPDLGAEYLYAETALLSAWIPPVASVVESLLSPNEEAWGCKSLDLIESHLSRCGDDVSREAMEALRDAAASVLWNQVLHWIERGVLVDPKGEFFVSRAAEDASVRNEVNNHVSSKEGDDLEEAKFVLALERLPSSTVSITTARRVLFVGQAVRTLRYYEGCDHSLEMNSELLYANGHNWSFSSTERALELTIDKVYTNISHRLYSLLTDKCNLLSHVENMHRSFLLGDGMFYTEVCEQCDRIKNVGGWPGVAEPGLGQELEEVPGKKWWFHNRIVVPIWNRLYGLETSEVYAAADVGSSSQLSSLLLFSLISRTGPDPHAAGKLITISLFQDSQNDVTDIPHTHRTRLALCDVHSYVMGALSSEVSVVKTSDLEPKSGALLELEYKMPKPLKMLISPETYAACFRRLFALHRAQFQLKQCWRVMMSPQNRVASPRQLWALRSRMEFLIGTVYSYLQGDVVETSMREFRASILKSEQYEDLREAHGRYIGALRCGLFLDDAEVGDALSRVLALVHRLTAVVLKMVDLADVMEAEVTRLRNRFDGEAEALFGLLRKMDASLRLCSRLDFNGWFSG